MRQWRQDLIKALERWTLGPLHNYAAWTQNDPEGNMQTDSEQIICFSTKQKSFRCEITLSVSICQKVKKSICSVDPFLCQYGVKFFKKMHQPPQKKKPWLHFASLIPLPARRCVTHIDRPHTYLFCWDTPHVLAGMWVPTNTNHLPKHLVDEAERLLCLEQCYGSENFHRTARAQAFPLERCTGAIIVDTHLDC